MKSIRIHNHGGLEVLSIDEIVIPNCTDNKILVEVKACALNHLDIWVREGMPGLPITLPLIMGSDASGTVHEVGRNIKNFKLGDDVVVQPGTFERNCDKVKNGLENYSKTYGILGETSNGTQSEFILLDEDNLYLKPAHLSFIEASSMQLVFMTSYQMIVERAKLKAYETILIYGATSGIGSAAIQIAKDIGSKVISTVGSKEKEDYAYDLGSDHVFIHDKNLFKIVRNVIGNNNVDVIFEHIGSKTWNQSMKLLGIGGRLVTCGSTTGASVGIDLRHLFMKQQSILGSTMGNIRTFKSVMSKINKKIYQPFIDKVFTFDDIQAAHQRLEHREQFGKIIVVPQNLE